MTEAEQETFRRIFQDLAERGASLQKRRGRESKEDEEDTLDERMDQSEMQDFENDYDVEEMPAAPDESKIEAYPRLIRDLARSTQEEIAQKSAAQRPSADPVVRAAQALAQPIRRRMLEATTDAEVWAIVESELFATIRAIDLDATPAGGKQTAPKGKQTGGRAGVKHENLPVFSQLYQRLLLVALRIFCRRTMYTPFAFALLPAIKALGPSWYAQGVSPGLYNELLRLHWRVQSSMADVLLLLKEMDDILCPMNGKTLEVLEEITLHRWKAMRGDFGLANQELELLPDRKREGDEVFRWKGRIRRRLQEAELEKVQRKEQEQALREEGALGEYVEAATP